MGSNSPIHGFLSGSSAIFAGFAVYSFWQGVALGVTIVSGCVAIVLGCISLYDRVKFGPRVLRDQ